MWVAHENVDPTLSRPGIKPEAPSKPKLFEKFFPREKTDGQSPLEKLRPGRLTKEDRTRRYIEVMGEEPQRSRKILDTTYNTYSNVLANEFMAIYNAQQDQAQLQPWQETFLDNVRHHLEKDNPDFDWEGADRDTRYSTFFSAFDKLLRSDDKDKAEQWMTTAMLSAKRQILALQVSTGAHVNVLREGDRVEHVSDVRAMSAMVSFESGRPVSEVNEALSRFDRFLVGTTGSALVDKLNVFRQIYLSDPTAIQRLQNDADVRALWKKYEMQARKRLFSTVRIDFNGGVFNNTGLDAAQQQYIRQLGHLSTAVDGQVLQKQARDDVEMYMTSLVKAQQDAYYVKFDKQLLTEDQLNLVKIRTALNQPPRLVRTNPGVSPVRSTIEGVGNLNVGLGNRGELTAEFGRVMDAIKKEVSRDKLNDAVSGKILQSVTTQIAELGEAVSSRDLSEADRKRKETLEEDIEKLDTKSEQIESYETAKESWESKQVEVNNRENELAPLIQAQTELGTKQTDQATEEGLLEQLKTQKSDTEREITELKSDKQKQQEKVTKAEEALKEREVQHQTDLGRRPDVDAEITRLQGTIAGANINNPAVQSTMARIQQLEQELSSIDMREREWPNREAQLSQRVTDANTEIGRINGEITAKENAIKNPGGLNEQIRTKQGAIQVIENRITELNKLLEAGKTDLAALDRMRQEVLELEAQKNARASELDRLYADITLANIDADIAAVKPVITATKKTKQQDIESIDTDLEIARLTDGRKKEVLVNFQSEVLSSDKWHQIFKRARAPRGSFDSIVDGTEQPIDALAIAVKAKTEVPPAYIRMIQIVGGDKALEQTAAGKATYQKISSFLTPDIFLDVIMKDPNRVQVLRNVYFGGNPGTLPADLGPYDPIMQSPEMRKAMMRFIDAGFTEEVMSELLTRAGTGKLGELTDMEKQTLPAIAQRERQVSEQGLETERKQFEASRLEAIRHSEWSADQLKLHAVVSARAYIAGIPGLVAADAPVSVRIANAVLKEKRIGTRFIRNPFPAADEAEVRRQFQDAGVVIPAGTAAHVFINNISRFNLVEEDFADELAIQNADADLTADIAAVAALNPGNRDAIVTSVRGVLVEHNLPFELSNVLLATEVAPGVTLKQKLQAQIDAANGVAAPLNDDQMKAIVRDSGFVSEGTRTTIKNLDDVSRSFMERGGSVRDAIWINAVLADLSADVVITVKNKLNALGKKDRVHSLDELMAFLPEGEKQRVMGRIRTYKSQVQQRYAAMRGIPVNTVNVDDETQVPDSYIFDETANYVDTVMRHVRGLPAPQVNSFVLDSKRRLKSDQDIAGIDKESDYWSNTYWGLQGQDLILALELALGGDAHRDEAIKLAREIEKKRTSN